jgi:hypothetical protein
VTRRPRRRPPGPGPAPLPPELADPAAPAVYDRRCPTCVFRSGNRMQLRPGRLQQLVDDHRDSGTALVCHETIADEAEPVLCRGYFDRYGAEAGSLQVLYRLGGHLRVVPAPATWPPEPDTSKSTEPAS